MSIAPCSVGERLELRRNMNGEISKVFPAGLFGARVQYMHSRMLSFEEIATMRKGYTGSPYIPFVLAMSYLPGPSPDKYCCHSRA